MILENITKSQGSFDLQIDRLYLDNTKIYGLIGANGSGKSTLARIIMGIAKADTGSIDYQSIPYDKRAYMAQNPYILQASLRDNITYPLKIRKEIIDDKYIEDITKRAGIYELLDQDARSLSSGQIQKVSFLRSIIYDPDLIIIDETLSNLDIESTKLFLDWILELQEIRPRLWIFISHQLSHIQRVCDDIIFIHQGKITNIGTKENILNYKGPGPLSDFLKDRTLGGLNEIMESD